MDIKYIIREKVRDMLSIDREDIENAVEAAFDTIDTNDILCEALHEALSDKIEDIVRDEICTYVEEIVEEAL